MFILFFLIVVLIPAYLFFMFIFPQEYVAFLVFLYEPLTRIAILSIAIIAYILYHLRKQHHQREYDYLEDLSINPARVNGEEYFYSFSADPKNKIATIHLYIYGDYGYDCMFKFENRLEKTLKSFRLIHECQSGDRRFDETIFIVSDDLLVCKYLKENEALRDAIFELFWLYKEDGYRVKFLKYFDGKLSLYANKKDAQDLSSEEEPKDLIEKGALAMRTVLPYLPPKAEANEPVFREKTGKYFFILLGFLHLCFLNGTITLYIDSSVIFMFPNLVDETALFVPAFYVSVLMLLLYLLAVGKIFYKSTRLALAVFVGITYGFVGFYLSALVSLKEIDIYLDTSKPIVRYDQVVSKRESHGRSSSYHVTFRKLGEIKTDSVFYKKFALHEMAKVYIKKGYLNMPWVYKIDSVK